MTKDDKVEILATALGTFMLGGTFAKEFFTKGFFEFRIFLFALSPFILLLGISLLAEIRVTLFQSKKLVLSSLWFLFFLLGTVTAIDLFSDQFIVKDFGLDIRGETIILLSSYTISTNLLYVINRDNLKEVLKKKTIYKYLLAPLNGLSFGIVLMGGIVWLLN